MENSKCDVCGLLLPFDKHTFDGENGFGNWCACCGIEFGFDDASYESTKVARTTWLQGGARWAEPEEQPEEWDLAEQLSNVIYERPKLIEALNIARNNSEE